MANNCLPKSFFSGLGVRDGYMIGSETFLKFCPNFLRWYGTGFLKQPAGAAFSLAEDSRVLALGVYMSPTIGKSPPLVRTDAYETLS